MAVDIDALRRVHFLAPLKDRELRKLAGSMSERRASAGEDLVTQGSGAIAFFVLLEGHASVIVSGQERRMLGPGDHFGEIALVVPDTPRTATVRAIDDVRLGALARWNFKGFVADHPEVTWPLLVGLARQIASTPGD
jgi:CRP/FNR family cyclic AMP-dependent transcriptional regulator